MKKVLYITPHLSTGGQPQYLLKKIRLLLDTYDIYVIEYRMLSAHYIVQRNQIIGLLDDGHFLSLGNDKNDCLSFINKIKPEIIHFEEIPELFMDDQITRTIYSNNRSYLIFETSHTVEYDVRNKKFLPDRFIFVSPYQVKQYQKFDVPKEVVEYPIEYKSGDRPLPEKFSPDYKNVLIVGLFTPNKNQSYVFDIAKQMENEKVLFHFVGNQAQNFESYWKPLMVFKPKNCIVHGEKPNIDDYYANADLVIFPSNVAECAPLVIRETLGWSRPLLLFDMKYYDGKYKNMNGVEFLSGDVLKDSHLVKRILDGGVKPKVRLVHLVTDPDTPRERESIEQLKQLEQYGIEYIQHNNERYTKKPPVERSFNPDAVTDTFGEARLSPAHYGCYLAHKYGILGEFTDDIDFLIVAEADCKIEVDLQDFVDMVYKAGRVMVNNDITYFSFGDKLNLESGYLESPKIGDLGVDFMYETNKIICAQCIMFKKQDRQYLINALQKEKWQVADLWYNIVFQKDKKKFAILEDRMAIQIDGFSVLDQKEKVYRK